MKDIVGKCALCGTNTQLAFEHVPPKVSFNNHPAKLYDMISMVTRDDKFPWNIDELRYKSQQKGTVGHYLCSKCNSDLGAWYVPQYNEFIQILHSIYRGTQNLPTNHCLHFDITQMYPLNILKQISSMFCAINHNNRSCDGLKNFVLNKESKTLDKTKYRFYIYASKGPFTKIIPFSILGSSSGSIIKISEISTYPIGFVLVHNQKDNEKLDLLEITSFSNFNYNQKNKFKFYLPIKEVNSPFPTDYRTQSEFIDQKNKQEEKTNG